MKHILLLLLTLALSTSKSDYKVIKIIEGTSNLTLSLAYTGQDDYYISPISPIAKHLTFTILCHAFG